MSTIIKADEGHHGGVAFNLPELSAEARSYFDRVQGEAKRILVAAQQEADEIRRRAEQEGHQAAFSAAERTLDGKLAARMETVLPALRKVAKDLAAARHAWQSHWEQQAVHLAAAMARRIARRELRHQPDITLSLVSEALELAAGRAEIRILLNPEDHRDLGDQIGRLASEAARLGPVQVAADPSVSRGGCRVETRHGAIDETFEAQLDRIEKELL